MQTRGVVYAVPMTTNQQPRTLRSHLTTALVRALLLGAAFSVTMVGIVAATPALDTHGLIGKLDVRWDGEAPNDDVANLPTWEDVPAKVRAGCDPMPADGKAPAYLPAEVVVIDNDGAAGTLPYGVAVGYVGRNPEVQVVGSCR